MLSKIQKIWLWIFGGMCIIPEILFWFTPLSTLSIINNLSGTNIKPLAYFFINSQFFIDHPIYLLLILLVEWIGVFGLLLVCIKIKKKIISVFLGFMLLWLSFILLLGYVIAKMTIVI